MNKTIDHRHSLVEAQAEVTRLELALAEKMRRAIALTGKFPGEISMDKLLEGQREAAEAKEQLAEAKAALLELQKVDDPAFVKAKQDLEQLPEVYAKQVVEFHKLEQATVDSLVPIYRLFLKMRSARDDLQNLSRQHQDTCTVLGIRQKRYLAPDMGKIYTNHCPFADFMARLILVAVEGRITPKEAIPFHE